MTHTDRRIKVGGWVGRGGEDGWNALLDGCAEPTHSPHSVQHLIQTALLSSTSLKDREELIKPPTVAYSNRLDLLHPPTHPPS